MTERLLQFIWQFQYFNRQHLAIQDGTPLTILFQGQLNTNQGPDFSEGKVKIGNTVWAGNIELHVKASDWHLHKHHISLFSQQPVNLGGRDQAATADHDRAQPVRGDQLVDGGAGDAEHDAHLVDGERSEFEVIDLSRS